MKILIASDMEGITGVTNWDQVNSNHAEYPRFRRLMTHDINAAIRGALLSGADEVLVTDGHDRGTNILLEELDPRAHLICGDYTLAMIQGIDQDIDGVIFVGYHARAGSQAGILDHTWSSRRIANLWLNEVLVGEYGLNGAVAGYFNVPVLMLSGDQTACSQATDLLGNIETAIVKRAISRMAAGVASLHRSPKSSSKMLPAWLLSALRLVKLPSHLSSPTRCMSRLISTPQTRQTRLRYSQVPGGWMAGG